VNLFSLRLQSKFPLQSMKFIVLDTSGKCGLNLSH
jgi:hypothetical protein